MPTRIQTARINHVAITVRDLDESEQFYREVLGCERLQAPNFGFPTRWLRLGQLQLHLQRMGEVPAVRTYQHFAVQVTDFDAVYRSLAARDAFEKDTYYSNVWVLPSGEVQLFARDPSDNLFEVDCPDVHQVDLGAIRLKIRYVDEEQTQLPENRGATLFLSPK